MTVINFSFCVFCYLLIKGHTLKKVSREAALEFNIGRAFRFAFLYALMSETCSFMKTQTRDSRFDSYEYFLLKQILCIYTVYKKKTCLQILYMM